MQEMRIYNRRNDNICSFVKINQNVTKSITRKFWNRQKNRAVVVDVKREGVRTPDLVQVSKELISKYVEERDIIKVKKYNI